ncbi:TPA: hypothetical protein L6B76_02335 [Pseudomonas aeruginosa]|nr:hypothetical protein [Pseudomonas aeruginosa]
MAEGGKFASHTIREEETCRSGQNYNVGNPLCLTQKAFSRDGGLSSIDRTFWQSEDNYIRSSAWPFEQLDQAINVRL